MRGPGLLQPTPYRLTMTTARVLHFAVLMIFLLVTRALP